MEYLVGAGGWGYFNINGKPSLKAYSQVFNFVEVNTTFYEYPNTNVVESWRRSVPADFTFSVRCHQDLTHKIGLKPVDEAFEVFNTMKAYCNTLESPFLVLETPASCMLDEEGLTAAESFFSSVNLSELRLVWEYRAPLQIEVAELMADFGIIRSTDLSVEPVIIGNDVIYSRLFGKGKHNRYQFTDNELLEVEQNARAGKAEKVILAYHGQRMYSDAARSRMHIATGKFFPVTNHLGVESVKAVLAEDAAFPSTKSQLIEDQGWKVFDLTADKRMHISEVLDLIPNRSYSSLDEVTKEVKAIL